ncbi:MAG: ligase-associated DNA damage response endonuclease PdeM [Gemmatimonadota bacterium]|nr:ligase-associated DNA damage response endonuclease PdeM [Gemmatimonadota bacterium]
MTVEGDVAIQVAGETLVLLPEGAAFWRQQLTLLVADLHWGKAAVFRAAGIPVPAGTTSESVRRLDMLVKRTNARRVVFLGDLLHAKSGRSSDMFLALGEWSASLDGVELLLVRGNHDRRAGDPPPELRIVCVDAPHLAPPFVFAHHPGVSPDGYVLAGHVHPGVRLYGPARQSERLPCFVIGTRGGILPAFGAFTGLGLIEPAEGDRIFVIAEDRVLTLGVQQA